MVRRKRLRGRARVTAGGRVTIPKAVREHLGLRPGEDVEFVEVEGIGGIVMYGGPEAFRRALDRWHGYLRDDPLFAGKTVDEVIEMMRGPGPEK